MKEDAREVAREAQQKKKPFDFSTPTGFVPHYLCVCAFASAFIWRTPYHRRARAHINQVNHLFASIAMHIIYIARPIIHY